MDFDPYRAGGSLQRTPPSVMRIRSRESVLSAATPSSVCVSDDSQGLHETLRQGDETENLTFREIKEEKASLKEFLFNDNNKISKNAIRFILTKWSFLEERLCEEIVEREKIISSQQSAAKAVSVAPSYAQAVASSLQQPDVYRSVLTKNKNTGAAYEIVLIKPENDKDVRNNDDIKKEVYEKLKNVRSKLKVRKVRQMRNKGIIVEVNNKNDVELIKQVNLSKIGLKIESPNKISPSIVIYDIENDMKEEELKDDFILKNFDYCTNDEVEELKVRCNFYTNMQLKIIDVIG